MTYCFKCEDCGRRKDVRCSIRQRNSLTLCICGNRMTRDLQAEQCSRPERKFLGGGNQWRSGVGVKSDSMGVDPTQAREAYEQSVRMGVPTQFDRRTGAALWESRSHRRKYCNELSKRTRTPIVDRDGGCGDPTGV